MNCEFNILLVEDNPGDARLVQEYLKETGKTTIHITTAETLAEAFDLTDKYRFDAVLLDLNLPDSHGLDTFDSIHRKSPLLPVIIMTGLVDESIVIEAVSRGAQDYLTKGEVDGNILLRAIKYAIERKKTLVEIQRHQNETKGLLEAARAVLDFQEFQQVARRIFYLCCELTGATMGYVVLLSPDDLHNEVLFLELGGLSRDGASALSMPECGLLAEACAKNNIIYDNNLMSSPWAGYLPPGHVALKNVLFAPLVIKGGTVGIISLANKPDDFTENDIKIVRAFSDMAAIALSRFKNLDALREREARYRLVADNTIDCIWLMNMDLEFTYINSAIEKMTGFTPEEWIGSRLIDHCDTENFNKIADIVMTALESLPDNHGLTFEAEMFRKDGMPIPVEITGKVLIDETGQPIGFQGVTRDIIERKALEEQLFLSQKMEAIGRLAGGVAHDFNNNLTPIVAVCDILLYELPPEDPLHNDLKEIQEAADRCTALTRQLLAFGRKQVFEIKTIDLNEVVSNMEKILSRTIGEDIDLKKSLYPDVGRIRADRSQLEQIILNLAVNARDAMPSGGKLTIETANVFLDKLYAHTHIAVSPGPYVMLAVSDSGHGIEENVKAHIFEPFFTTKEKGKGTGLGLATVYGIVKQSGGNIWCYSEPGKGTTFIIYLPRADDRSEKIFSERDLNIPFELLRGTESILLAEDEENVRKVTRRVLENQGYRVYDVKNGAAALEIAKDTVFDLLLTDVVMPGMNGKELSDQLISIQPQTKTIFMSGYTDNAIVHHGVLTDGLPFLQKPFSLKGLCRKIRQVLDEK